MTSNWDMIRQFYSSKGIFVCRECGRGKGNSEIDVTNVLFRPADDCSIGELERRVTVTLTPSHRAFLRMANGAIFFSQCSKGAVEGSWIEQKSRYHSGFALYPAEAVADEHEEVVSWLGDLASDEHTYLFGEDENDRKEACLNWLEKILVVGEELNSGNYLAIDYNRKGDAGEFPIIFLDHELPFSYSNVDDDQPIIARSVDGLLLRAMEDPAGFLTRVLGATATYSDGKSDIQWFPEAYTGETVQGASASWRPRRRGKSESREKRMGPPGWDVPPLINVSGFWESRMEKEALPDDVVRREIESLRKIAGVVGVERESKRIPWFCDVLLHDYIVGLGGGQEERAREVVLALRVLKDALGEPKRDYVRILVTISYLLGRSPIPVKCDSWPTLASLGAKLYASVIGNLMGRAELDKKAHETRKHLFPAR